MNAFKIATLLIICSIRPLIGSEPSKSGQPNKLLVDKAVQTDDVSAESKKEEEQKEQMEVSIAFIPRGNPYARYTSKEYLPMSMLKKDATVSDLATMLASYLSQKYDSKSYDNTTDKLATLTFIRNFRNFTFYKNNLLAMKNMLSKNKVITSHKSLLAYWPEF